MRANRNIAKHFESHIMYKEYFGLSADPFRISAAHSNLYSHQSFTKARSYLQYGLHNAEGIVLITGDGGSGKTSLVNSVIDGGAELNLSATVIDCTDYSGSQLLAYYARILGSEDSDADLTESVFSISQSLNRLKDQGRKPVLVLDDAQLLTADAIRKLTLLANLRASGDQLLQIFLVGDSRLRAMLLEPQHEQLHQRLVAACHIDALTATETNEYILQNLRATGWNNRPAIASNVYTAVHRSSLGNRRWINLICSRLLLHAIANETQKLELPDLCEVLSDLINEGLLPQEIRQSNLKAG